jgi:type III secretion protein R
VKGGDLATWLLLLAAVPFALVLLTSFVKFAVVLAIVQRAFGAVALPPATVAAALALLFALFVTAPVGERIFADAAPALKKGDAVAFAAAVARAAEPVRAFLLKHTPARERQSFLELQRQLRPAAERAAVAEDDLLVLAPAFAVAELRAAFQVGFFLYLPFLVLELVVATILLGLGMTTLAPETVSLPFKLLLFVVADGWHLLFRALVLGYT